MPQDSDADRIHRERERRKAAERSRAEDARRSRQLELTRLRLLDASHRGEAAEPGSLDRAGRDGAPSEAPVAAIAEPPTTPPTTPAQPGASVDPPRAVGGPIAREAIHSFLAMDPSERFDVQVLNETSLAGIVASVADDPNLLRAVAERAEVLMIRVKHEIDDPLSAGAFLRERVLEWYRRSPAEPTWPDRVPARWAGLFADSRVSGGRLVPWLNIRLWTLREEAARARGLPARIRRGLVRDRGGNAAVTRTPAQQIQAEVAQAVLDDLAAKARDPEAPLPLVRLSELAVRRQVQTVNDALAGLFASPETGPFVILHPNRYPDCEELDIRPPTPGASGAALAYSLSPVRSGRRPVIRGTGGGPTEGDTNASPSDALDAEAELDATTIWEAEAVSASTWIRVVDERRRERHRLDSPPKEYRQRAAWASLRALVMESPDFRKAFLAAKWRGRPSGLPLVAQLLQKGTFAPDVSTDHEYLEAELGELVQDDPQWRPTDNVWHLGEWTITRDGTHREGFRYRADEGRASKAK